MADLEARMTLRLRDLTSLGARSARQNLRGILREARQLTSVTGRLSTRLRRIQGGPISGGYIDGAASQMTPASAMEPKAAPRARKKRHWGVGLRQAGMAAEMTGRSLSRMGMLGRQALGSMFSVAMDFEQQMANVSSVILGVTDKGMDRLTTKAKELGATTRFTATEVGEAMLFMGQAGLTTDQILQGVGDTLNLAAAGNLSLGKASDIATDVMAAFGLEAKDMGRISDVLVTGAMSATTNVSQLGMAMSKIGPLAKGWGVSIEEATAITASFANIGLKGGIGGRAFRRILLSLVKPSKNAAAAMRSVGLSIADKKGNLKKPLIIFQEMAQGMKKLSQAKRIKKLATIFGAFGVGGATEAATQFSQSLDKVNDDGESAIDMLKIFNRTLGSQGRAQEIATKRMDTNRGKMLELKSVVQDLAITLSDMKISGDFLRGLKGMALDVRDFINADPGRAASLLKGFVIVTATATIAGPLLTGLGTIARVIGFLASSGGIPAATAALAKMSAVGTAGVLGVVAAVGAMSFAIGSAIDDWLHLSDLISGANQSNQGRGGVARVDQLTDDERMSLVKESERLEKAERKAAAEKENRGLLGSIFLSDAEDRMGASDLLSSAPLLGDWMSNFVLDDNDKEIISARKKIQDIHDKGISRGDTKVGGSIKLEVVQTNSGKVGNHSGISVRVKDVKSDNPDVPITTTTGLAPAGG